MSQFDNVVIDGDVLRQIIAACLESEDQELDFGGATLLVSGGSDQDPKLFAISLCNALKELTGLNGSEDDCCVVFEGGDGVNADVFRKRALRLENLWISSLEVVWVNSWEPADGLFLQSKLLRHTVLLPLIKGLCLDVNDEGLKLIAEHAEYFTALEYFYFRFGVSFGDEGIEAISRQANKFVRLETISDCDEHGGKISEKGALALLQFTQLKTLYLCMGSWAIGDDWLELLASRASEFSQLNRLDVFDAEFGDRGIKALADNSQYFERLVSLSFGGSKLSNEGLKSLALAWHRGGFGRLEHLNIYSESTKISIVAPEVLGSGNATQIFEAVLDGLSLPEAKVLVLGEPAAGKTSLCRRVFLNRPADPSRRKETHDFELLIPTWRPRVKGQEVTLRVWDFGGQHVLHGTHEMFLTSRSVCVLVVDSTQVAEHDTSEPDEERNGNRLTYWLKMIRHFVGQDAHVILVETKNDRSDNRLGTTDVEGLRLMHQFARPIRVVNGFSAIAGKGDGAVADLRREIHDSLELLDLPRVGRPFVAIKDLIDRRMRERALIGLEEYRRLCQEIDIRATNAQDGYLRTLYHFGSVFFFGLHEVDRRLLDERRRIRRGQNDLPPGQQRLLEAERDPALQRWLINPHWLKRPLYELIRKSEGQPWISADEIRKAAHRRRAQIESDDLNAAEDVLFAVLKLTELCFHDRGRGKYFFPRGLSRDSGAFLTGWEESNRHEACWEWEFFPETVIHRFIVQAHERQEVLNRAQWRTGVVLQRGEAMVAIQSQPERGQVLVWLKKREDSRDQPSRADGEFLREVRLRFRDLVGRKPDKETRSWDGLASGVIDGSERTSRIETNLARENAQDVSPLSKRLEEVYLMYEAAKEALGDPKDREAFDWITALAKKTKPEYEMLGYETWVRYLREARKLLGTSKNTPRSGRTGRSIVSEKDI